MYLNLGGRWGLALCCALAACGGSEGPGGGGGSGDAGSGGSGDAGSPDSGAPVALCAPPCPRAAVVTLSSLDVPKVANVYLVDLSHSHLGAAVRLTDQAMDYASDTGPEYWSPDGRGLAFEWDFGKLEFFDLRNATPARPWLSRRTDGIPD